MAKFGNRKTTVDGIRFDSKKEAMRYQELRFRVMAGEIQDLRLQVPFELIPAQRDPATGKIIEWAVVYKADFAYWEGGRFVVEDVKGVRTPEYIIKRKLMLERHGIRILEV